MYKIAVLAGDGIGPEIVTQAVNVIKTAGEIFNTKFEFQEALLGGCAYEKYSKPLPDETSEIAKNSDAVL